MSDCIFCGIASGAAKAEVVFESRGAAAFLDRLVYRMKRPRGGSLFLLLRPDELLARLATLVPPPRVHGLRYHGVFAPNSKVRRRVVPAAPDPVPAAPETPARMTEKPLRAKPAKIARKVPRSPGPICSRRSSRST